MVNSYNVFVFCFCIFSNKLDLIQETCFKIVEICLLKMGFSSEYDTWMVLGVCGVFSRIEDTSSTETTEELMEWPPMDGIRGPSEIKIVNTVFDQICVNTIFDQV